MSPHFIHSLKQAFNKEKILVSDSAVHQLSEFINLLNRWNQVYNLTAIKGDEKNIYLHLIDSLLVAPFLRGHTCLDVGSGGGLPGIPLAIYFPEKKWTLLDKSIKKTRFLTQVIAELELKNVEVVTSRCEDFHFLNGFDSILCRAFATLPFFIKVTRHLIHPQGLWLAMKGRYQPEELRSIPDTLHYEIHPLQMVGMEVTRHVICIYPNQSRE